MYPFFFGETKRPLFGRYLSPNRTPMPVGVLMCPPLGQEYMRTHFAFKRLAALVAEQGLHSMRFDYFGAGDSSGTCEEMSMASCLDGVSTALQEFRDTAGIVRVSMLGLRFGALVGALTHHRRIAIESLILWDPIVSGKTYIEELRALETGLPTHPGFGLRGGRPVPMVAVGHEELIGYTYANAFIEEIERTDLLELPTFPAKRVYLFVSEENDRYTALRNRLQADGILAEYQFVKDAGAWNAPSELDHMLTASRITAAIADTAGALPRKRSA